MDKFEKRKQAAVWLNTLGYDIEFDKDGFWMEEYSFTEHKTKDVIDLMISWSDHNQKKAEITRSIIDTAFAITKSFDKQWVPTMNIKWIETDKYIPELDSFERILNQKFIDKDGNEEWFEVECE